MDPGVVQVKNISHSYIFNKIDLFLLLPRKLVLRCTQIITYCGTVNYYKCHRIQAAPSPGQIFKCFADVYGLLQNFCQSYPHNTAFTERFWHMVIHFLCAGVAFQKYFVFLQKTAGILL